MGLNKEFDTERFFETVARGLTRRGELGRLHSKSKCLHKLENHSHVY